MSATPSSGSPAPSIWRSPRTLRTVSWVASMGMLAVAGWLLHRYLGAIAWHDVAAALAHLPMSRVIGAIAATGLSFAMLASFDVLAASLVAPARVSARLAAFAGAIAHALSNTLGFHALTGGAVRYRIYHTAGLGAADTARIVSLAGLGVGLGYVVLGALVLWLQPAITAPWGRAVGMALSVLLLIWLVWLAVRPRVLRVREWTLTLPRVEVAGWQMLLGGIEMTAAIGAMYLLLPAAIAPPFADFVPLYLAATLAGIVSHAPGGLGVFEAIMLAGLSATARADGLAALLCYRLVYNLLPFALAALALATFEARQRCQTRAG